MVSGVPEVASLDVRRVLTFALGGRRGNRWRPCGWRQLAGSLAALWRRLGRWRGAGVGDRPNAQ